MSQHLALSVLETQWPARVPALAPELDRMGYHRLWLSEHHSRAQSGSPLVLSAVVAERARRLRVGPAGVLLRYTSPARVAIDAALLETLYPGRVDLGLANAAAQAPSHEPLLDGRPDDGGACFESRADQVLAHLGARRPGNAAATTPPIGLTMLAPPSVWICGQSDRYAEYAATRGTSYAYHHFLAQLRAGSDGPTSVRRYEEGWTASGLQRQPASAVVCYGCCAASETEARRQWQQLFGIEAAALAPAPRRRLADGVQRPSFLGTPSQCADQLMDVAAYYGVTELTVQCFASTTPGLVSAYGELAAACRLASTTSAHDTGPVRVPAPEQDTPLGPVHTSHGS